MKTKFKKRDLFWVFLYINIFCKGIGLENDSKIYFVLIIIGTIALIFKFFSSKYKRNELFFIFICGIIGISSLYFTKKPTLLLTCMCIVGLKDIDLNKTFKGMYKIRLVTFLGMVILSLLGLIENNTISTWRLDHFDVRNSLGFGHPNTLHLSLFILIALYIYISYDNLKFKNYIVLIFANLFIYYFSLSRTGMIVTMFLIFITYISKKIKSFSNILIKMPKYTFGIMLLLSFGLGILYNKVDFAKKANEILNGRVAYSSYYLTNYKPRLFGNNISQDTNAIMDNGYIILYVQNGIAALLFLIFILHIINKNVEKNNDIRKSILLVCFYIYIFAESFSPNIFMNIVLFFIGDYIYSQKKENKNEFKSINYCSSI